MEHVRIWMDATVLLLDVAEKEKGGGHNIPEYGSTSSLVMSDFLWCRIGPVGKLIINQKHNNGVSIMRLTLIYVHGKEQKIK